MRDIAKVLASESDLSDMAELVRRITFNVLIGNGDMHLKNWSLTYPDTKRARLSPAYDVVSTIQYIPGDQFALKFSRSRKFSDFSLKEMTHFAVKTAVPERFVANTISETVALFMEKWGARKEKSPSASRGYHRDRRTFAASPDSATSLTCTQALPQKRIPLTALPLVGL